MRKFLHNHGLALIAFGLFFLFWIGMGVVGYFDFAQQQHEHGRPVVAFWPYFASGHFWEATFENWESEFLQMGLFVLITAYFFEKGSAESKTEQEHTKENEEETEEEQEKKMEEQKQPTPWPIHKGKWLKKLYDNSLSIALLALFLFCFIMHAFQGVLEYNVEQAYLGQPPITVWQFLATPNFWFQSLQNWQSEFLAVGSMTVLTIYFRQKGSAESKRVGAPSGETGGK